MTSPFTVANEKVILQLRWHHQFQFAGYYMALEKGYYDAAGIDVLIQEGGEGKVPIQDVVSGQATYGVGNIEVLTHYYNGAPLVAIAAVFQHSPSLLLVRQDSDIYLPSDLVGKRVMLYPDHHDPEIEAMLHLFGVKEALYNRQESSKNIDDLVTGRTDAFNSYLTNEPFYLEEKGIPYRTINPRDYGIDFYSDILFTTRQELKYNPDRVKAFRDASLKGWKYALDHPEETIRVILNKYGAKKSLKHITYESRMIKEMISPSIVQLGYMNEERWDRIAQSLRHIGIIKETKSIDSFLYHEPAPVNWYLLGPIVIAGALITIFLIFIALIVYKKNINLRLEIKKRKSAESEALKLSTTDSLTGLANRRLLYSHLKRVCNAENHSTKGVLIYIDLDGFKMANDLFGHDAGDKILLSAGNLLTLLFRKGDIIARLGGDEFVVLIEGDMPDDDLDEKIWGVQNLFQSNLVCSSDGTKEKIVVTASIGVTKIQPGDTAEIVLKRADKAMYSVKTSGKKGVSYLHR